MRHIDQFLDWLYAYLLSRIKNIPKHIALTPNGNRRWAKIHGIALPKAYEIGAEIVLRMIELAQSIGIESFTVFGLAFENMRREQWELDALKGGAIEFCKECRRRDIQVHLFGEYESFRDDPKYGDLYKELVQVNTVPLVPGKFTVHVAVKYSGRRELLPLREAILLGKADQVAADPMKFILSAGVPEIDFSIRTGARRERRVSGLVPFQMGYAELFFPWTYLGDFTRWHFLLALWVYSLRKRNFGK